MTVRHTLSSLGSALGLAALSWALSACSPEPHKPELAPLVKTFTLGQSAAQAQSSSASHGAPPRTTAAEARADLAGEVMEVLVRPGQSVLAGQALVRIDPRDARLADSSAKVQAAAARAELAAAEADFARYTNLREKAFISQAEWERRGAALAVSRAQFEATLDRLGVSTVRALAVATVRSVAVTVGQTVEASQHLAHLAPARPVQSPDAAAPASRGLTGMVVPITALLDGQAVMKVVATSGGFEVHRQPVVVGAVQDREAQIRQGLAAGDRVVAVGAHLLSEGQAVRLGPDEKR